MTSRLAAEIQARRLLMGYLSPYQREMHTRYGYFYVRGADKRDYALFNPRHCRFVVVRLDGKHRPVEICGLGCEDLPASDSVLVQLLLLRANPALFHSIACHACYDSHSREWVDYFVGLSTGRYFYPPHQQWPTVDGLFKMKGPTMGTLHILGPEGDITLSWNAADEESVAKAQDEWTRLSEIGFEFFNPEAKRPQRLKQFSRKLGKVIAAPGIRSEADKESGARPKAMSGGPNRVR